MPGLYAMLRRVVLLSTVQVFVAGVSGAQNQSPAAGITVAGSGGETFVLISGIVGGVPGFQRLSQILVADGNRVVTIDPYYLSLDSAAVSFDVLARRVDAELGRRGITGACVIGHAHGGGVALRLAASFPSRVSELILVDVGAMAVNRSPVFTSSMKFAPIIAKLPFGRGFLRERYLTGIQQNSARTEWLNSSTRRAYADPVLDNIGRVIRLAMRLAKAEEPEPVSSVVSRVNVPVILLLGEVRLPAGPNADELSALEPLGALLHIETVRGTGHFPHEESPTELANHIRRRAMIAGQARLPQVRSSR